MSFLSKMRGTDKTQEPAAQEPIAPPTGPPMEPAGVIPEPPVSLIDDLTIDDADPEIPAAQEPAVDGLDDSLRELFAEEVGAVDPLEKVLLDRLGHTDAQELANELEGLVNIIRAGKGG